MIRRIICLLLLPALLLNQAAMCCAHSHEGQTNSAPHIHLSGTSHDGHSHVQSHGHYHDASSTSAATEIHGSQHQVSESSQLDHHHDAVFFCKHGSFLSQTSRLNSVIVSAELTLATLNFGLGQMVCADYQSRASNIGFQAPYPCAIFLQLRSLRL